MIERYLVQASSYAADIDGLIMLIGVLVGFWFFLSLGVFFALILKFRAKDGQKAQYITGEEKQQKRWITIPHLLVLVCDVFILVGAIRIWTDVKQTLPEPQESVRVIGQQWAWTFVHAGADKELGTADDITKVNELHLAVNTVYHYHLESLDVLHDFSIPVFRLKQDAVPGRTITGWFEPTMTGEWDVQCAEICGVGHGLMGARVFVKTPEQQAAWVAQNTTTQLAANAAANADGE